jgi:hypothetical protein
MVSQIVQEAHEGLESFEAFRRGQLEALFDLADIDADVHSAEKLDFPAGIRSHGPIIAWPQA